MKFMTVREMRGSGAGLWRDLSQEKECVVTNNGRPIAILIFVDDDFEGSLADIRRARATRAMTELQRASLARDMDGMSMDEIDAIIADTRKGTKRDAHRP
ncbi:MAG: type II toxin-antitoxin system Phd/YefM family antitoxin [Proteobacteria bacterium]|nr:type II toxin-antitoxin system Phd/YefM family antitoxin [Pseudomonadota bacterium]